MERIRQKAFHRLTGNKIAIEVKDLERDYVLNASDNTFGTKPTQKFTQTRRRL